MDKTLHGFKYDHSLDGHGFINKLKYLLMVLNIKVFVKRRIITKKRKKLKNFI